MSVELHGSPGAWVAIITALVIVKPFMEGFAIELFRDRHARKRRRSAGL